MTDDTKSPTPAIPEAAVEAVCDVASHVWGLPIGHPEAIDLIAAALPYLATPAPADNGAGVKPLVWAFDQHTAIWWADSVAGCYNVWQTPGYGFAFFARAGRSSEEAGATIESAKAAAQADYEARIRSALVPATSVVEPSDLAIEAALLVKRLGTMQANAAHFGELLWHPESPLADSIAKVKTLASRTPPVHPAPVGETPAQEPVEWRYLLFGKGAWKHVYNRDAAEALLAENATLPKKRRHVVEPLYAAPVGERDKALEEAAQSVLTAGCAHYAATHPGHTRGPSEQEFFHVRAIRALARSKPTKEGE